MQPLDRPTSLDEAPREPVQQLRMRGTFSQPPEVVRRPDQSFAEMSLPDAIDHDPCRQRMRPGCEPRCQFQSAASLGIKRRLLFTGNDPQKLARNFLSQREMTPSQMDLQ